MKPAEYAQELGISRQAVYAKIKRGILQAKNVEGKLYIVIDKNETKTDNSTVKETAVKATPRQAKTTQQTSKSEVKDYKSLLEAKDETISVLKGTVKDLKKSNKQISTTLKGEIDLLKEAFHEMRSLYVLQLEQKKPETEEVIEVEEEVDAGNWIGLRKFFKLHQITKEKQQEKMAKRLSKAFKKDDARLMNVEGKLKLNADADFQDIL